MLAKADEVENEWFGDARMMIALDVEDSSCKGFCAVCCKIVLAFSNAVICIELFSN